MTPKSKIQQQIEQLKGEIFAARARLDGYLEAAVFDCFKGLPPTALGDVVSSCTTYVWYKAKLLHKELELDELRRSESSSSRK